MLKTSRNLFKSSNFYEIPQYVKYYVQTKWISSSQTFAQLGKMHITAKGLCKQNKPYLEKFGGNWIEKMQNSKQGLKTDSYIRIAYFIFLVGKLALIPKLNKI